jgi:hypothetical protein
MGRFIIVALAFSVNFYLVLCEAAAQTCSEGCVSCVVGGKKGERCCTNGKLSTCIPDLEEPPTKCGGKVCAGGKVCVNAQCVCEQGFTDCGGTCRDLSTDSGNCGACTNACPSGTRCQPATPVIFARAPGGLNPPTPPAGVCTCLPPAVSCGGVCRNPLNDSSNCGTCGKVCTGSTTECREGQCVSPDTPPAPPSAGSTGSLPLDLVWKTTDPNGIPLNPDWRARSVPAMVEGSDVKDVDVAKACPQCVPSAQCLAICNTLGFISQPCLACHPTESCWRQCTTFPVTSDGGFFCGASHINWRSATYEGRLEFDDYSARGFISSIFDDDDYTFNLTPHDGEGLAGRSKLHPEMSFLETVDRFPTSFWTNFRRLVDRVPGDDLSAPRALFNRPAIVIGLQGLDTQHGTHEELHPIWAMALRRTIGGDAPPNRDHDCWAVFARNWGNEGFCSNHQWYLERNHITFRFPLPGATAVTEISREFGTNSSATSVSEVSLVKDGAEVTFFLGRPEDRTQINGEICLRWAVPPGTPPLKVVPAATSPAEPELDRDAHPGVELLTRAQINRIARSLPKVPARDKRQDLRVPKRVPAVPPPANATPPPLATERVGPVDPQKQVRDRRIHELVCEALRGNPKRPKMCDQP